MKKEVIEVRMGEEYFFDQKGELVSQEKKLTPRVGDRVVMKDAQWVTRAGTIDSFDEIQVGPDEFHPMVRVVVDGKPGLTAFYEWDLTVVDRELVEWPEGWGERTSVRPHAFLIRDGDYRVAISPELFERIRGPEGGYVAKHLDELLGGDS